MPSDRIEVTYRVITPMFCGGAGGDTAEVRLPSFKGVLRWWWRALAWSRLGGDLAEIRRAEDALFGSARGGQSKLVMRQVPPRPGQKPPREIAKDKVLMLGDQVVGDGARYFGYGVMEAYDSEKKGLRKGQLSRACLEGPFELSLEIRARELSEPERALLLDALRAIGLLGGLGAKSRKGYGSLAIQSLVNGGKSVWSPPASAGELQRAIAALLPAAAKAAPLPDYTALSPRTRIVLLAGHSRQAPLELLDRVGREMMRYRSWGNGGIVLGKPTEANFRDDHDLMKEPSDRRRKHPRRIAFGLPHNYGKKAEDQVGPAGGLDRRASPLLIHVHQCGEAPVAVLSFLPATFLPGGDAAKIDVGGARVPIEPDPALWQPIEEFLGRFFDPKLPNKPFGAALEVRR